MRLTAPLLAAPLLFLSLSWVPPAQAEDMDPLERQVLIDHVLQHWGAQPGPDEMALALQLETLLYSAPDARLNAAALARNREELETALTGPLGEDGLDSFGDTGGNLVYFPLAPCRILDTRVASPAGGRLAAETTRAVYTQSNNTTFAALQGGTNSDCGLVTASQAEALVLNLTVVNPASSGFLTVWPSNLAQPTASSVNYTGSMNLSNEVVVPVNRLNVQGLSVFSRRAADLVIDVTGYYARPQSAAFTCYNAVTTVSVPATTTVQASGQACATGYSGTGGGCEGSNQNVLIIGTRQDTVSANRWRCTFRNNSATAHNGQIFVRCCRSPGR